MRTSKRDRERQQGSEPVAGSGHGGASSDEARRRARRLLELGDEAIRRALSRDSESFLAENRQQGGE